MNEVITAYLNSIKMDDYSIIVVNAVNEVSIQTNMSEAWRKAFISKKLYIYSDIFLKAKERILPFLWHACDSDNNDVKMLSEKYNIRNGLSFIMKIKSETVVFTLYFSEENSHFIDFYEKNKSSILYNVMALFEQHYIRNSRYVLTCREKDVMACLKWGKTCSETGTILGISERTVRFHIRNISDKLNVTTTRYAVVKAIAEGLI